MFTRREFCKNIAIGVAGSGLFVPALQAATPVKDLCWVLGPPSQPGFVPCTNADGEDLCRGVGRAGQLWSTRHLKITFKGGASEQHQAVVSISQEWTKYAAIQFDFGQHDPADVRIAFAPHAGHWSFIGTDALNARAGESTMNLAWVPATTDQEKRRTCLHEFGHMLGLEHEHQSPNVEIPWDKPKVYDHYEKRLGWSRQKVDLNIFQRVKGERRLSDEFDPKSIMVYPIPRELLTRDFFETGGNTELSAIDKRFITLLYPGANYASAKNVYAQALAAFRKGDFSAALAQWQPLALGGYPDAMLALANLYMTGRGVSRNPREALRWYQQAAEWGAAVAHVELGLLLQVGEPSGQIPTNPEKARQHYQEAEKKGNADGMFYLALCYLHGIGGPTDREAGIGLLKRAVRERDHRMSQRRLITLGEAL